MPRSIAIEWAIRLLPLQNSPNVAQDRPPSPSTSHLLSCQKQTLVFRALQGQCSPAVADPSSKAQTLRRSETPTVAHLTGSKLVLASHLLAASLHFCCLHHFTRPRPFPRLAVASSAAERASSGPVAPFSLPSHRDHHLLWRVARIRSMLLP